MKKKLEEIGVVDNTVVILMSDNGGESVPGGPATSNVPLRAGKGRLYEGGIREPMVIKLGGHIFRLVTIMPIISVAMIIGSCVQEHRSRPEVINERKIPVIYGTDLFHPHDDPDDHFDLATLFAMSEFDVKAILLDMGAKQKKKPGRTPVEQILKLTGRRLPYATGLSKKLISPDDKGLVQPKEDQVAVELLLQTLRQSAEPVIVITTGSVRDLCAAFNREPKLLRERISRLYINIGNLLENKGEWNVHLDRKAYVGLMRSGLPIYWCPCLPVNENRSTHWKFKHGEVLEGVPPTLLNWFIYALQVPRPHELDPTKALTMDLRPWRHILMSLERNMWCTGSLIHAAGRSIYRVGDQWVAAASGPRGTKPVKVFTFVPVHVEITDEDKGYTKWSEDTLSPNMHVYKIIDPNNHEPVLKSCLRCLLHDFPVVLHRDTQ